MGTAIGQFLSHAVGVAISPLALIAMVLILTAPRGRSNALWFALGWLLAVAALFVVVLVIGGAAGAHRNGQPGTWVSWFRLVLGILLTLMTIRQLRLAARAQEGALPARLRNLQQFTAANCLALGATLALANPKNVTQIAAGAVSIAAANSHHGVRAGATVVFLAIASVAVLAPLAVHLSGHRAAQPLLHRWKDWTVRSHYAIMAVLFALLAAKSLGDGIVGLT